MTTSPPSPFTMKGVTLVRDPLGRSMLMAALLGAALRRRHD